MIFQEHTILCRDFADRFHLFVSSFFGHEIEEMFIGNYCSYSGCEVRFCLLLNIYKSIVDRRINGFLHINYWSKTNFYIPKGYYYNDICGYIRTCVDSVLIPYEYNDVFEETPLLNPKELHENGFHVFELCRLEIRNIFKMIELFVKCIPFYVYEYVKSQNIYRYIIVDGRNYCKMSYIMESGFCNNLRECSVSNMKKYHYMEKYAWEPYKNTGMILTNPNNIEYVMAMQPDCISKIQMEEK